MSAPRILLASNFNAWREPFNSQSFEFFDVISSVEAVDVIAPFGRPYTDGWKTRPSPHFLASDLAYRLASAAKTFLGLPRVPSFSPVSVEKDYDLFFYMCQFPNDLANLQNIKGWRKRSKKAAAFVLESWSSLFHTTRGELKLLDDFDHVFVLNKSSIEALGSYTKAPCSFLATAADCLKASPFPNPPRRDVDVYSMGRRSPVIHDQLLRMMQDDGRFYVYDVWKHGVVPDWRSSRALTMNLIKRSKFFIAYDHTVSSGLKIKKAGEERSLSTRYFEGAAGGAVMLGSRPDCPEFDEYFDWTDAVIDLPLDVDDVPAFLRKLERDPDRLYQASHSNAVQSLLRHDWSHRWAQVLATFDMPAAKAHEARLESLSRTAEAAQQRRPMTFAASA
ncbi:glycosyltransferase [Microvirga pudoricolor]|uniref:glycosyltransferase n=1 Tax=Microvirga pudoricolor TaxID=2778729 RepID=UPI00194E678B|nr:glycosyltransferase [Microvirga pudoricolor]MBM6593204.1 glycosyltransferase family 1 protein [Microvirga pudoricolor]